MGPLVEMYDNPQQFIATVAGFLGGLYTLAAGLNLAAAASSLRGGRRAWPGALAWGCWRPVSRRRCRFQAGLR